MPTSAKDLTYMKIYTLAYGLTLTRHSQNVIFETLHGYKPVRASICEKINNVRGEMYGFFGCRLGFLRGVKGDIIVRLRCRLLCNGFFV